MGNNNILDMFEKSSAEIMHGQNLQKHAISKVLYQIIDQTHIDT